MDGKNHLWKKQQDKRKENLGNIPEEHETSETHPSIGGLGIFGYEVYTYKSYGFQTARRALFEAKALLEILGIETNKATLTEALCFTAWMLYTNIQDKPKALPTMLNAVFDQIVGISKFKEIPGERIAISEISAFALARFNSYSELFGQTIPNVATFNRLHEEFLANFNHDYLVNDFNLTKMFAYHIETIKDLAEYEKNVWILW